ncbi:helix-turn-helix protein [Peptococcaceae bacterium CEB3]|nr:helix-turn-helix protein [Peptococcaceae bacterium CEB3]
MVISDAIKNVLNRRGMTSAELARRMGCTRQHVSDLLADKRRWNETTLMKACEALGVELALVDADAQQRTAS